MACPTDSFTEQPTDRETSTGLLPDHQEEKHLAGFFLNPEAHNLKCNGPDTYKYLPYGTGKRMCVGSGLGRVVMFLKVTTYLQCFTFESVDGGKVDVDSEYFGVTLVPEEQNIKVTARPAAALAKSVEGNADVEEH